MLAKPPECLGCPLYGDGQGFVPDHHPPHAIVTLLGQNPGADEERGQRLAAYGPYGPQYEPCAPQPLVGPTGWYIRQHLLPHSGLAWDSVGRANVLKCRWRSGNDLPPPFTLRTAVTHCTQAHLRIPSTTRLVVAMGDLALATMAGRPLSITQWRGYLVTKEALDAE